MGTISISVRARGQAPPSFDRLRTPSPIEGRTAEPVPALDSLPVVGLVFASRQILACDEIIQSTFDQGGIMPDSVYKIIELVGTSTVSWEKAAAAAVERAGQHLRDLRIAEVVQLDMHLKDGKVETYRAKVKVSFKYQG